MSVDPLDSIQALGVAPEQLPRHIAIIMDGNGRWAKSRGLPRIAGHERGARSVRAVVTHCARLGIDALTLYSFSAENWKRPKAEVDFLMGLYGEYLIAERGEIMDNNVQLVHVGRREGLPDHVLREMDETVDRSSTNTGLRLCLALNYGSRLELVDAVRGIARDVRAGTIEPDSVDESMISDRLYTGGLPDPDLLIRTANERRISNFLLWQISYAEIYVTECLWPDFDVEALNEAIRDFSIRERRFGDVIPSATNSRSA